MALMWRVTTRWAGGQIGNGFTNQFFTADLGTAQQAADAVRAFFVAATSAGANIPTGVTHTFPSSIDVLDPVNGQLITAVPVTPPLQLVGSGSGNYAAPSGSCVTWQTTGVVGGHRVNGRTFLVPLAQSAFQSDGTLSTVHLSDLATAATALIAASPELVVWHRPTSFAAGGGSAHPVVAAKITDKVAILTSRR